jgi:DNA polymerase III epsilon subunit-like protein
MKYVSIDLETLGLDPEWSDIIEFWAVLDDLKNPLPIEELPKFHAYIYKTKYKGEPYAMAMHSDILKKIDKREVGYNYLSPESLGFSFKKFLLKNGYEENKSKISINVAGKNFMSFDDHFLKNSTDFKKHIQIRSRTLDPAILYFEPEDETLPSLDLCLKRAGIDKEVRHTALEDSLDVVKLIRKKLSKDK